MNTTFPVHESNLAVAAAVIKKYGTCYLHADGNIYDNKEASDFRINFSNPKNLAAQHRVILHNVSDIPDDLEELEKMFYAQKQQEDKAAKQRETTGAVNVKTITLEKPSAKPAGAGTVKTQAELDEEELQRQIDAEAEEQKRKAAAGGAQ